MSGADRRPARRGVPAAVLPVAVAAAPVLGYVLGSLIGWGGDEAAGLAASCAGVLAAATAGASLFYAAARERDKTRRDSWYWFAAAAVAWSAGVAVHAVARLVTTYSAVTLSFADLFALTGLFALVGGLVTPVRLPRAVGSWLRYAADTYVCATAVFVIAWVAGLGELYRISGESPADFLVELAFPVTEVVLACAMLSFAICAPARQRRSALLAYAALVALAAAGVANVVIMLRGAAGPPSELGELAELAGLLLLSLAPWVDRRVPDRPAGGPDAHPGGPLPDASAPAAAAEPVRAGDTAAQAVATGAAPDDAEALDAQSGGTAAGDAVAEDVTATATGEAAPAAPTGSAAPAVLIEDDESSEDGEDGEDLARSAEDGRLAGPGLVPAALAAVAVIFVAGRALAGFTGLEPAVSVVAGSAVLAVLARLAYLMRENTRLLAAVETGEGRFRALAETVSDAVLVCDLDGTIRYVGPGAGWLCSLPSGELVGRRVHDVVHPEDLPRIGRELEDFVAGGAGRDDVLRLACRVSATDGTWLPIESTVSRYARSGQADRLLITTRDFSEQAALRRQVDHLTFTDGLTGLPNRAYFEERTSDALIRRHETDGHVAVVFIDLDGFTAVNDSAGHASGDQVLAQAARRLRAAVPSDDPVARWGGDEFGVLVRSAPEPEALVDLAERLLRTLSAEPYKVAGRGVVLSASLGIAFAAGPVPPVPGGTSDDPAGEASTGVRATTAAELIRNADVALSRAKELGGGRVEVFAARMHADVVRRLELGSDLQRALTERQFAVEFQPVVELATSRVTGVEALVRWRRHGAYVPPEEFLRPAEEFGLMPALGEWILGEACAQVARWRRSAWDIGLSVNLSPRQIAAPRFVESVAAALEDSGLPPGALTLEVTEELVVDDVGQTLERLRAVRDLGVRLAIDDFGTGYASLAFLGQLPVDVIKIDPSFVAGLGRDETRTLLTRTIVRLGRDLGLIVVAEGIERSEQLALLREMGCPRGQGYLVARPMAPGGIETLVRHEPEGAPGVSLRDLPSAASAS